MLDRWVINRAITDRHLEDMFTGFQIDRRETSIRWFDER